MAGPPSLALNGLRQSLAPAYARAPSSTSPLTPPSADQQSVSAPSGEMRILDQADGVAVGICHHADANAGADVAHGVERLGACLRDALPGVVGVLHAPVGDDPAVAGLV